jgi:hypothetical protein
MSKRNITTQSTAAPLPAQNSEPASPPAAANRASSGERLTRERALEILCDLAERAPKDSDRLAALRLAGLWCGWGNGEETDPAEDAQRLVSDAYCADYIYRLTRGLPRPERTLQETLDQLPAKEE